MDNIEKDLAFFEGIIRDQFMGPFASSYDKVQDWTSMQSLIVVSTIDEHFDVLVNHSELKKVQSLKELYELVIQKMN